MRQVKSDKARRTLGELLDAVKHHGEHVAIFRYTKPDAMLVPVEWYADILGFIDRSEDERRAFAEWQKRTSSWRADERTEKAQAAPAREERP